MKSEIKYTVIKSGRKTLAIQLKGTDVIVRAPYRAKEADISSFVDMHRDWIEKHLADMKKRSEKLSAFDKLSEAEISELVKKATDVIPKRVEHYAALLGVTYGRITVRIQKTRWGSCSRNGNLSFNGLLMLAPDEVLDSVIVHELCHRKEMNHSKRFYSEIEKIMPDYKERRAWLREHGEELMKMGGRI